MTGVQTCALPILRPIVRVPVVTLDEDLASGDPVSLLKIDCEGFELNVLRGAKQILERDNPWLFLEIHPTLLPAFGQTVEEVLADMAEAGPTEQTKSALRKIYEAVKQWARTTFGLDKMSDKAVQQIVANARNYVIEGGEAAKGDAGSGRARKAQ